MTSLELPDPTLRASRSITGDRMLLLSAALLLIATGIGLRDPWPADEPRFALIARDMVLTGDWWVPRVGGDIYSDKPPLFFWLIAAFYKLTGSLRWSFLLPSVPALALVCAPYALDVLRRLSVQRILFGVAAIVATACSAALIYLWLSPDKRMDVIADYAIDPIAPLALLSILTITACAFAQPRRGLLAYVGVLAAVLLVVSFWLNPAMNSTRSGQDFVQRMLQTEDPHRELGIVSFKEQYLLNLDRTIVHFGHARWREGEQEIFDAAKWLSANGLRQLVVSDSARRLCFPNAQAKALGNANRLQWWMIEGHAEPACIARGDATATYLYVPRIP